jgi:hypothetical protein
MVDGVDLNVALEYAMLPWAHEKIRTKPPSQDTISLEKPLIMVHVGGRHTVLPVLPHLKDDFFFLPISDDISKYMTRGGYHVVNMELPKVELGKYIHDASRTFLDKIAKHHVPEDALLLGNVIEAARDMFRAWWVSQRIDNFVGFLTWEDVTARARPTAMMLNHLGENVIHIPHANHYRQFDPNEPDVHDITFATHLCCGGQHHVDWYRERGNDECQYIVTGNPHFDEMWQAADAISRDMARRVLDLPLDAIVLTVIGTEEQAHAGQHGFGVVTRWMSTIAEAVKKFAESTDKQVVVVYKPHPSEAHVQEHVEPFKSLDLRIITDFDEYRNVLASASLLISCTATNSATEAAVLDGVPLIYADEYKDEVYGTQYPMDVDMNVDDIAEAIRIHITSEYDYRKDMADFVRRMDQGTGSGAKNVAQLIREIAKTV